MKNITIDGVEYNITPVIKEIKKDYEILSVITNNNKFIEKVYNQDATIEPYWKIHSVKRLSDGEIFTIGDIVKCEDCKGKITSLEIYGNDIYLTGIDNKMPFGFTLCKALDCFEIPQKIKTPLFTTEDGVDIFEGDDYYHTDIKWKIHKSTNAKINSGNLIGVKGYNYFSTKEKAEEYILMNEPVLSLKDVASIYPGINKSHPDKPSSQSERLKNLVKSKIQQSV